MARKSKSDSSTKPALSEEQRDLLSALHAALGILLGSGAAPAKAEESDDGLEGLDGGDEEKSDDGDGDDLEGLEDEAEEEKEEKGPSEDDVRAALKKVLKAKDKTMVAKILKKFGAESVSDLDEAKYADVIKTAAKVIK